MAHSNGNTRINLTFNDFSFSDEMLDLAQYPMPEPPTANLKCAIADHPLDREVHELAWNAYDTANGAADDVANLFFAIPTVVNALGRAIDVVVRWQRFNAAVAGAFLAALWPAVGLPAAADVEAIRINVRSLREELRAAIAARDAEQPPMTAPKSSPYQISAWPQWLEENPANIAKDVGH
jgi:hypothetical protein